MKTKKDFVAMANGALEEGHKVAYVVNISLGVKEKYNGIEYLFSTPNFTSMHWKCLLDDLVNYTFRTGGETAAYFHNGDIVAATRDWSLDIILIEITRQGHTTVFKWIDCEELEEIDNKIGYIGR